MSGPPHSPGQTVGPFFGMGLPYERGYELVPPGTPGATLLHGIVYDGHEVPVPDAMVEIRQAGPHGLVPQVEGSLARHGIFTGWGRAATDPGGRYHFTTLEPGGMDGAPAFFAVVVFARGLLDRVATRAYLPGSEDDLLRSLAEERRATLVTAREAEDRLRFDIHLQGPHETVFLDLAGDGR